LIVLVDQETWSAAEEFAALLQDNRAATVMGARTGGAGCGYTYGGDPTTLKNSGVVLKLPDCVRFRSDGSNEVRGIIPDVPIALRADDGLQLKAKLVADRLPDAIAQSMLSRP
jgi:C-terminal processing protease CtpA/Prc